MLASIINQLTNKQLSDLKGSKLNCKIPLSSSVINMLFEKAIEGNTAFESIKVISIHKNEITLHITIGSLKIVGRTFEFIDREIVIQINPILEPPNFEVEIEVLDGIRRIENEILEMLFNRVLKSDTFDFDNRTMIVNHRELFDNETYQQLLKRISAASLETLDNKILYNLQLKF